MALSEHEKALFDQMERELRGEIKEQFGTPRPARWFLAVVTMLAGLGVIVVGVSMQLVLLGALGFAVMLAALVFATSGAKPAGASAAKAKPKPAAKPRSGSFFEDRWNNRTGN